MDFKTRISNDYHTALSLISKDDKNCFHCLGKSYTIPDYFGVEQSAFV